MTKVTVSGVLAATFVMLPTIIVYCCFYVWIHIAALILKYLIGEHFMTRYVYYWFNKLFSFSQSVFFSAVSIALEFILRTQISYTIADKSGYAHCLSNFLSPSGEPELTKIFSLPSSPEKVKIIIVNHYCRLDWVYLMCFYARMPLTPSLRIVLKDELRRLPIVGWAMEIYRYIFLTRSWEQDAQYLKSIVTYDIMYSGANTILIFPEGTDLSPSNVEKSNKYAAEHGLQQFHYVLNPRTKGLIELKNLITQANIESVIDLTIAYSPYTPGKRPVEESLINGSQVKKIHLLIHQYTMEQNECYLSPSLEKEKLASKFNYAVPWKDEEFSRWIHDLFSEKEKLLGNFYDSRPPEFNEDSIKSAYGVNTASVTYDEEKEINKSMPSSWLHKEWCKVVLYFCQTGISGTVCYPIIHLLPIFVIFTTYMWIVVLFAGIVACILINWLSKKEARGLQNTLFLRKAKYNGILLDWLTSKIATQKNHDIKTE